MWIIRAGCLLALVILVVACLEHERHAFDSAVAEAQSDVDAHVRNVGELASIDVAQNELDRHAAEMDSDLARIRSRLSDFDGSCHADDLDRVWDEVHAIEDRIAVYLLDAGRLTDTGAMRTVSARYAADMAQLLEEARDRLDDASCR